MKTLGWHLQVYSGRGLLLKILHFFKDLIKNKRKKYIKTESKVERDCKTKEKERLKVKWSRKQI